MFICIFFYKKLEFRVRRVKIKEVLIKLEGEVKSWGEIIR